MLFGRIKPPAELRSRLAGGERLLALAEDGPATIAASQLGLWLPDDGGWRRISWDDIVKATWSEAGFEVIEGRDFDGVVLDAPPLRYRLSEPRNLPAVVRQRVEHSIARWEQVRVPGGTARIVARRRPGQDGLRWTARLDAGTPDSAQAREVLAGYLDRVRAEEQAREQGV
jgi:hypothetical protein